VAELRLPARIELQPVPLFPCRRSSRAPGRWQQVVAINLDNWERMRELVAVIMGSAV
jgi:hypothetical protein